MSKWRWFWWIIKGIPALIRNEIKLQAELEAWDRASHEALINFENALDDNTFDTPSAVGDMNARSHAADS